MSCEIHYAYNGTVGLRIFAFDHNTKTFTIKVKDPYNARWASRVVGKYYPNQWTWPTGEFSIGREYVSISTQYSLLSSRIQHSEHILTSQLENLEDPHPNPSSTSSVYSWLQITQNTLTFLNLTTPALKLANCILCASLHLPLLAAVPHNITNYTLLTSRAPICPITNIPLWEPEASNIPLPICTCIFSNFVPQSSKKYQVRL